MLLTALKPSNDILHRLSHGFSAGGRQLMPSCSGKLWGLHVLIMVHKKSLVGDCEKAGESGFWSWNQKSDELLVMAFAFVTETTDIMRCYLWHF